MTDPILERLRRDAATEERAGDNASAAAERFCTNNLSVLADLVHTELSKKGFNIPGVSSTEVNYEGADYAAWELASWPPNDLDPGIRSYTVYYLAHLKKLVAVTVFWRGGKNVEEYNPNKFSTPVLNIRSIYFKLAHLPRDYYFKRAQMDRIP